jgi:integrating conjugative element protein (TIGR03757 family)
MPTRSLFPRFLFVLFLTAFCLPAVAEALVFTDSAHPVQTSPDARVIELDRAARIEAELSAGLPADPERAAKIARQRVSDRELQMQLQSAYQDIADARGLAVRKIPAVVVDRRYVVYGETDVSRALARIESYRRSQP